MSHTDEAFLAIWHDVQPGFDDEYLKWHTFEHLPERLSLPGFKSARRYRRIEGTDPEFVCFVHGQNMEVFKSSEYLARLNSPTSWTREMMPHYKRVTRSFYRKLFVTGENALAPYLACIRFHIESDRIGAVTAGLEDVLSQAHDNFLAVDATVGAIEHDQGQAETEEKRLRGTESGGSLSHLVLISAIETGALQAVMSDLGKVTNTPMLSSCYELSYASFGTAFS